MTTETTPPDPMASLRWVREHLLRTQAAEPEDERALVELENVERQLAKAIARAERSERWHVAALSYLGWALHAPELRGVPATRERRLDEIERTLFDLGFTYGEYVKDAGRRGEAGAVGYVEPTIAEVRASFQRSIDGPVEPRDDENDPPPGFEIVNDEDFTGWRWRHGDTTSRGFLGRSLAVANAWTLYRSITAPAEARARGLEADVAALMEQGRRMAGEHLRLVEACNAAEARAREAEEDVRRLETIVGAGVKLRERAVVAARAEGVEQGRREVGREMESGLVMLGMRPASTDPLDLVAAVGRALGERREEGRRHGLALVVQALHNEAKTAVERNGDREFAAHLGVAARIAASAPSPKSTEPDIEAARREVLRDRGPRCRETRGHDRCLRDADHEPGLCAFDLDEPTKAAPMGGTPERKPTDWSGHPRDTVAAVLVQAKGSAVDFREVDAAMGPLWTAFESWVRRNGWPGEDAPEPPAAPTEPARVRIDEATKALHRFIDRAQRDGSLVKAACENARTDLRLLYEALVSKRTATPLGAGPAVEDAVAVRWADGWGHSDAALVEGCSGIVAQVAADGSMLVEHDAGANWFPPDAVTPGPRTASEWLAVVRAHQAQIDSLKSSVAAAERKAAALAGELQDRADEQAAAPSAPPGAGPGQMQRIREGLDAWATKLLADRSDETIEAAVRAMWLYRDVLSKYPAPPPSAPRDAPRSNALAMAAFAYIRAVDASDERARTSEEHEAVVAAAWPPPFPQPPAYPGDDPEAVTDGEQRDYAIAIVRWLWGAVPLTERESIRVSWAVDLLSEAAPSAPQGGPAGPTKTGEMVWLRDGEVRMGLPADDEHGDAYSVLVTAYLLPFVRQVLAATLPQEEAAPGRHEPIITACPCCCARLEVGDDGTCYGREAEPAQDGEAQSEDASCPCGLPLQHGDAGLCAGCLAQATPGNPVVVGVARPQYDDPRHGYAPDMQDTGAGEGGPST